MTAPRTLRPQVASGRVIELGGSAIYDFHFPSPQPTVYEYFCDVPGVLRLLPDTLSIASYGPDRYRLIVGASDGHGHAMSAIFDLAARMRRNEAIWIEPSDDGPPVTIPGMVFHGALWAEALFQPGEKGSRVRYSVELEMNIPIPSVLRFMPQHFLQNLGERTMEFKMTQMINGFARGVHRDFHQWMS